jgi:hypothetical protein
MAQPDLQAAAVRLIQLLPAVANPHVSSPDKVLVLRELLSSGAVILTIVVVLVAAVLFLAARCELSSGNTDQPSLDMQSSAQRQ